MKTFKGKILPETHPESVRVRLIAKDIIEASQRELKYEHHHSEVHDDDKGVQERRSSSKVATYHLEGLNWEILVVDDPIVDAFFSSGGKIVVFTGLLNVLRTDAEIATIIGHETWSRNLLDQYVFQILKMTLRILLADLMTNLNELDNYLLDLPFSQRMEKEADYIGLLLLASAGYDLRGAPKGYEKLWELGNSGGSLLEDYLYTHPSGKKRAQL
ncbi:mitochondrial metalloendopeptidase OMA1-like [Papaver somniferum]|uniref:mitochondrial metalloendopeptidase OMA1-like n=1 Tax=Papaver somniferum TaxID=3469 RepID=UPI000E6FF5D4|nr:mitochondrial metalloendopeptidase OMA1-like [Papaver somniferum]